MTSPNYGRDAWMSEPDREEWVDAATGYPCLAQRGPVGAWCGYVAVPVDHPTAGLDYYSSPFELKDFETLTVARVNAQRAVNDIEVHGGLTYAGNDRIHAMAAKGAWWFGFDCAHSRDYCPRIHQPDHAVLGLGCPAGWGDARIEYRTLEYVREQSAKLAAQLAAIQ